MRLHRPLFLEGEAGVGKTALAQALAESPGADADPAAVLRGHRRRQALYDWDFPRQLLHLRALEAPRTAGSPADVAAAEASPVRPAVPARPAAAAGARAPARAVLLVDEIDRADDEFEAFLLEVLATSGDHPRARHDHRARCRRWSCSPPTAPARCTTRSSAAASTTGSSTRRSTARSRSCGAGCPRCREPLAAQVAAADAAAARRGPAQAAGRRRDARLGAGAASRSAPATLDAERGGAHPGRRAEVPRGRRAACSATSTGCWPAERCPWPQPAPRPPRPALPRRDPAAARRLRPRCARPGCRTPDRTASFLAAVAAVGSTAAPTSTGPAG